jgi:cytoskeletal protein CcmA (bactofilin family)
VAKRAIHASSEPAVLGRGLRVRGRIRANGDLRIDAEVEGDVTVQGSLELGENAVVAGGIDAEAVTVAGSVDGDVAARGAVAITSSGRVRGDVKAGEVNLEEGGRLVGRVDVDFSLPGA